MQSIKKYINLTCIYHLTLKMFFNKIVKQIKVGIYFRNTMKLLEMYWSHANN